MKYKINFSLLKEGDVFFTAGDDIVGKLIRWATGGSVSHCGQLIKPYGGGLFYKCEMVKGRGGKDLKFNPIVGNEIISIKRPVQFNEEKSKLFRQRMLQWHEKISYDYKEFFSFFPVVGSRKDVDKDKMICSRLVYNNLILMGVPLQTKKYDDAITPSDLFKSYFLEEVEGWQL